MVVDDSPERSSESVKEIAGEIWIRLELIVCAVRAPYEGVENSCVTSRISERERRTVCDFREE